MNDIIGLPYGTVLRAWLYFENPTERGQTRQAQERTVVSVTAEGPELHTIWTSTVTSELTAVTGLSTL